MALLRLALLRLAGKSISPSPGKMPGDEPPKPGDAPITGEYLEFEVKAK